MSEESLSSGRRSRKVSQSQEVKGRFTVENLNHVNAMMVSEDCHLLQRATTSSHVDQYGVTRASLVLKLKDTCQGKNADECYTMHITELSMDRLLLYHDVRPTPQVIACFIPTDDSERAILRVKTIKKLIQTRIWCCQVIVIAYRVHCHRTDNEVLSALKDLSSQKNLYSCIEASSLGKNLVTHCIASSLLAARPVIANMREASELCIQEEGEKSRDKSVRRRSIGETLEKLEKKSHHHGCRVQ